MWRWLLVSALLVGCPAPERQVAPIPPVSTGKVRVRVFTEPASVRLVTTLGASVFVATDDDLERWDGGGLANPLLGDLVPGSRVTALAADEERHTLWILTDTSLGSFDGEFTPMPEPTTVIDLAAAQLAPATEDGVWVGTAHGLWLASAVGWAASAIKDPVRAMVRDRSGWLWLATRGGLVARKPSGDVLHIGATEGCAIAEPRMVIELADSMLVIGADEQGHERIAIGNQLAWTTYRALPEVHWDSVVRRGRGAVVMGGGRVYRVGPRDGATVHALAREGMRLVPLTVATGPDWSIEPIDLVLPAGTTTLAALDDVLLVGTRELGTARYRETDVHPHDWLRRRQMFEDATTLTVACVKQLDCWVATGTHQAWHFTGDHFVPGGPEADVLAVVRDQTGAVYALHRAEDEAAIHVSRVSGTTWTVLPKLALATPGERAEISFARFAAGKLWIGLRYRDGDEVRPYGIAIVDPASSKVVYHYGDDHWQLPDGVVDADVRGGTAWFATSQGVARLANGQLKQWTTADGLRSETARAVTIAADGKVIIATTAGIGIYNGKEWSFPAPLRFEINDVIATHNAQIWMATERGIAAWDGRNIRRIDTLRGLVENEVLDLAVDQFDRVWARGPNSLTLVGQ